MEKIVRAEDELSFELTGPSEMKACVRLQTPRKPESICVICKGEALAYEANYDEGSCTTLITFASSVEGVEVKVEF